SGPSRRLPAGKPSRPPALFRPTPGPVCHPHATSQLEAALISITVTSRPHGSVVLSRSHAAGLIAMPGGTAREMTVGVRWLGASGDRADLERSRPAATRRS